MASFFQGFPGGVDAGDEDVSGNNVFSGEKSKSHGMCFNLMCALGKCSVD